MINGSGKKISEDIKELKDYSPPKKKKSILKKPKEEAEPLKLEQEEAEPSKIEQEEPLILDNFHEKQEVKEKQKVKSSKPSISPAARKMATEAKVDLDKIQGSGTVSYTHLTLPTTVIV